MTRRLDACLKYVVHEVIGSKSASCAVMVITLKAPWVRSISRKSRVIVRTNQVGRLATNECRIDYMVTIELTAVYPPTQELLL